MLRKLILIFTLMFAVPALANAAWYVSTSTSGTGSITYGGQGQQRIADETGSVDLLVNPGAGQKISSVRINGVALPAVANPTVANTITVTRKSTTQNVVAYFTATKYTVTTTVGAGGAILPAFTGTANNALEYGKTYTYKITPNAGYVLSSLKVDNADVALDPTVTFEAISGNHSIVAAFTFQPVVKASVAVTGNMVLGTPVTLSGVASTNDTAIKSYEFLVDGASVYKGTNSSFTFTPSTNYTKTFSVDLIATSTNGTAKTVTTSFTVLDAAASTVNSCLACHSSRNPQIAGFVNSKHWQNHLEVGPEFTEGKVEGQLNANESWNTKEEGAYTTCSVRCHFKNVVLTRTDGAVVGQKGVEGCNACHSDGLKAGGSFKNASSSMTSKTVTVNNTCLYCHSGSKHGKVPNEFFASKHWQNNFEYGAEFTNQLDTTVAGGTVTATGTSTDGYLNANDSYNTKEDGAAVTCAYRCHFRPGQGPQQNVAGYLANGKATGYVTYTDTTGKYGPANTVYSRPGGNSCLACHDPHGLDANAQSTCYTCHAGGNHGWSVAAFEKSSHFTGTYAKIEGVAKESCLACHNSHSTEAEFANMSSATVLHTAGAATGCQKCHAPGASYGIYSSNLLGKAPHFNTTGTTGFAYVQDLSDPNNTAGCVDCHYHDNTPNAGWAEGGHGKMGSPWNRTSATDKTIDLQAKPWVANSACARCHSAKGYAFFVDSGFKSMSSVNAINNTYSPLTCNGCHVPKTAGTKILNGKLRGTYTGGFKGYYGISTARNYFTANVVDTLQYADNKNSNGCMPCHSPRNTVGQNIKSAFLVAGPDAKLSAGNFSAHHGDYVGPVFNGKGGYDFTVSGGTGSDFGYQDRARHQRIGNYGTDPAGYNGTGIIQGSCVACHYASDEKHSLEITDASYINTCYKCHPTSFNAAQVATVAAENAAAVKALGNLLTLKAWQATGTGIGTGTDMTFNAAGVLTGDSAIAEKNIGANFNYSLLTAGDAAAWAHNPSYARRLIADSIDWLDDNVMNGSAAATILKNQASATYGATNKTVTALTAAEVSGAEARLNNPGCMGCHFGTGNVANGEAIPGVEQAPHYNTTAATVPGQTFTQAQFVVQGSQCNYCHGYGHGTDSPSYSFSTAAFPKAAVAGAKPGLAEEYAESAHGDINGLAWTDYDFKNRADCVACHTTKGFVTAVDSNFANTAAWGTTADTTKQVLGCNACHSSTNWKNSIRTVNVGSMGVISPISYDNVGESNVCIPCHATRENTTTYNAVADASYSNLSFKNPHYLGAAAVFYGKGGFQFYTSGVRYNTYGAAGKVGRTANWSHGRLGMDNYSTTTNATVKASGAVIGSGNKGQCAACHLGPTNTHTFGALEVANATQGTSTYTRGCYGCHNGTDMSMTEFIEEEKVIWDRMMDFFDYNLKQVNIKYTEAYPYFQYNATQNGVTAGAQLKNWVYPATGPNGGTGKQTMGAALNYKLLAAEPGKHVHNRSFGRALIADSIVYLQNGTVGDRSVVAADANGIINFSNYSAANPVGNGVSITTLKSYLTKAASLPAGGNGFARR